MKQLATILLLVTLLIPATPLAAESDEDISCARNVVIYFDASYSMLQGRVLIRMLERLEAVLADERLIRNKDQVSLYAFTDVPVELDFILDGRFIAGRKRAEALRKVRELIGEVQKIDLKASFEQTRKIVQSLLKVDIKQSNDFTTLVDKMDRDIGQISSLSPVENLVIVFSDFIYDAPFDKYRKKVVGGSKMTKRALNAATALEFSAVIDKENEAELADLEVSAATFDRVLQETDYRFIMVKVDVSANEDTMGRLDVDCSAIFKTVLDDARWAEMSSGTGVDAFVGDLLKKTRSRPIILQDSSRFVKDDANNLFFEFKVKNPNCRTLTIDEISLNSIRNDAGFELFPTGSFTEDKTLVKFETIVVSVPILDASQLGGLLEEDALDQEYSTSITLLSDDEYAANYSASEIMLSKDLVSNTTQLEIGNAIYTRHLMFPWREAFSLKDLMHVRLTVQASLPAPLELEVTKAELCGVPLTPIQGPVILTAPAKNQKEDEIVVFTVAATPENNAVIENAMKEKDLRLVLSWKAIGKQASYLSETTGRIQFQVTQENLTDHSSLELGLILGIFFTGFILRWIVKAFISGKK